MRIFAADDERPALGMLTDSIKSACPDAEIHAFETPKELLSFAETTPCDIAFLDIEMRGMTGVALAKKLKDILPEVNIIFVTGYDEYTGDAMSMHASGYIMKPVTPQKIKHELSDLRYPIAQKAGTVLRVKCFDNFDVYTADGTLINFERSKSKEVFAYLIYNHGTSHTIKEIAATLFEDASYDRKQQGYIQKIIFSMLSSLKAVHADSVVLKKYNSLSLNIDLIDCDYYRFEQSDVAAINSYSGKFMSQYSWAEFAIGYLDEIYYRGR